MKLEIPSVYVTRGLCLSCERVMLGILKIYVEIDQQRNKTQRSFHIKENKTVMPSLKYSTEKLLRNRVENPVSAL